MEEKINKLLDSNNSLKNHIKDFIEIFVEYYGEEQRNYIEQKFNGALYNGYLPLDEFRYKIKELEIIKSKELYKRIIENTSLDVDEYKLFNKDKDIHSISFENSNLHPIKKYQKYKDEFNLGEDGRKRRYYKENFEILKNYVDITFDEFLLMGETNQIPVRYSKASNEFKEYLLDYADISQYNNQYEKEKKEAVEFLNSLGINISVDNLEENVNKLNKVNLLLEDY